MGCCPRPSQLAILGPSPMARRIHPNPLISKPALSRCAAPSTRVNATSSLYSVPRHCLPEMWLQGADRPPALRVALSHDRPTTPRSARPPTIPNLAFICLTVPIRWCTNQTWVGGTATGPVSLVQLSRVLLASRFPPKPPLHPPAWHVAGKTFCGLQARATAFATYFIPAAD